MKNTDYRVILLSFGFGAGFWILDSLVSYFFLSDNQLSFIELFFTDIPLPNVIARITVGILFIVFGLALNRKLKELKISQNQLQNILHNVIPICITNETFDIIGTNESYNTIFGTIDRSSEVIKCYDERPGPKCQTEECPHIQVFEKDREIFTCETVKAGENGINRHFIVTATPFRDIDGKKTGIIETFQDITPRKILEKEKEELIGNLQEALAEVKMLSGFLPICASCKKIRDDRGYWTQIETYIRNHSEAEFSHGICPDCAEKLYGDLQENDLKK